MTNTTVSIPFYRWGNQGTGSLRNSSMITLLVNDGVRIRTHSAFRMGLHLTNRWSKVPMTLNAPVSGSGGGVIQGLQRSPEVRERHWEREVPSKMQFFATASRDSGCSWGPFHLLAWAGGHQTPLPWPCNCVSVKTPT